ncbi:MAG: DEAD/DEAH box helicase [Gemmataceae bacterium]|nr:DEAD/DEAH box helicase [Gemmataceae bacterium]MCI0740638.1 DEAD/DEAH box helicase [Gemmataceae bacterium]
MLILHAGNDQRLFLVWGEVPAQSDKASKRPRASKATGVARLPFDAGADTLTAVMKECLALHVSSMRCQTRTLWQPTSKSGPSPSSPLLCEHAEVSATSLNPWSVTTLPLTDEEAVEWLGLCAGKDTLKAGWIVGSTLKYWSMAMRFAGALTATEQFLPGFDEESNRAHWLPVIAGDNKQRFARLAQAMPPACRAFGEDTAPPLRAATDVLYEFLSVMVDALVRSTCSRAVLGLAAPATNKRTGKSQPAFASAHDQWLAALRSETAALAGTAPDRDGLADQVRQWQRPITVASTAPFRLCFRLEEPESDETRPPKKATWRLRYLLQAADDPSLLVPVADAWKPRGPKSDLFRKNSFDVREYLFASLGHAAAVCPPLVDSLKTATPTGLDLDAAGAHGFLTERAWLLEQAGYGMLLPAWWTRKGTKVRLSVRARVASTPFQSSSSLSLDQILPFEWQVALGGEVLSREELELMAKLKEPLVKVRGQWVQLSAEEIQAALTFWQNQRQDEATLRDIVGMALGAGKAPGGFRFEGLVADGWVQTFLEQLESKSDFQELPAPARFQGTLRPYQTRGFSWLAFLRRFGLGACLADDMGLGKTVQTLALIQRDWESNGTRRPTLLLCPMSVVGNWQKEAMRFTPELPVLVHHGSDRVKGPSFRRAAKDQALVLSSYALLHRDSELFGAVDWAGIVLDEAQNIKNPRTKQAQAARALKADYRIALTGTPVENHVGDLWSIMEFLNPGFLGNPTEFKRTFFIPIQAERDADATRRLQRLTGPFILRRLKTDKNVISDLPDKQEMKVFCNLTKEQASLYAAVVKQAEKALDDAEGIQRKGVVLATLSKLKQVCNHPAQFLGDNSALGGRSGKLARLAEMTEEILEAGDRALVFTQFSEMGELLRRHLQESFGREVLFLHGGVSKKQRDRLVSRFQSPDGPPIFLLSLKAGGTGLNLTAANHVFHFDRWWNPAVEDQATDRAFRIGQTRNVQVHKFLCIGTVEEKIDQMIESKQSVARAVVGTGEGWLTELSNDQLKDLFRLRAEALGE